MTGKSDIARLEAAVAAEEAAFGQPRASATEITDDAQWHALRLANIGGSEVGALFGLSPFCTLYSLWHEKAGLVPATVEELNEKARWGKLLEPLIAGEIGRTLGWKLERSKTYHQHETVIGAGCTLDFDVVDHEWGPGICETKAVFEYADYKRDWSDGRAPPHIELQAQHQMFVTGRDWCAIQVWVAQTATLMPALIRRRNADVIAQIQARIAQFWTSIENKDRPDPTGTEAELSIMRTIWPARAPAKVTEICDNALTEACSLYRWSTEQIPGLERERTARKAQLVNAAEDAELLIVPGYQVRVKQNVRGHISLDVRKVENDLKPAAGKSTLYAG